MNIKKKIGSLGIAKKALMYYDHVLLIREEKENRSKYNLTDSSSGCDTLVSIIIINRNGKDKLEILMDSLYESHFYSNYEIVFVDNASTDESVAFMEMWKDRQKITIVQNEKNLNFSEANNIGARNANGDYYLFLNNDTRVTDGWLDEFIRASKLEKAGAIGARLVYPKIPANEKNAPKSFRIQHAGIAFKDRIREGSYFIQPYNMDNGKRITHVQKGIQKRACVTAAALMVSKSAFWEVGGFDENYVYGYEDVDICLKLLKEGYQNYYCGDSLIYHYEFGTQNADAAKEVKERRSRNMRFFKKKWQRYLEAEIFREKLEGSHLFSEASFKLAVIGNKSYDEEFLESFEKCGIKVIPQDRIKKAVNIDAILCFDETYDITPVDEKSRFLVACIRNESKWDTEMLSKYSYSLDLSESHDVIEFRDKVMSGLKDWEAGLLATADR